MEAYFFVIVIPAYLIGLSIIFGICRRHIAYKKRKEIEQKLNNLISNATEITPEEFLKIRKYSLPGSRRMSYMTQIYNVSGVYILHNKTKDMYYVGQGIKVLDRVFAHFSGRGNGDVYADYKYGDEFTIRIIDFEGSGFRTLNELERNMIAKYNAFSKGYNKTRGNFVDTIEKIEYDFKPSFTQRKG